MLKPFRFEFYRKFISGGLAFYPWRLSLGCSFRYWPRIITPSIYVHIGPFKFWLALAKSRYLNS